MRYWFALSFIAACALPTAEPPDITVSFAHTEEGTVPFRTGGPFGVTILANDATQLGRSSRATVEIVTNEVISGATTSATTTLTDQDNGTLSGTAALAWPALRGRTDDLLAAARAMSERILSKAGPEGFTAAARAHMVGPLLFQARSGRLDPAAIHRACSTPSKALEIARDLGVEVDDPPPHG